MKQVQECRLKDLYLLIHTLQLVLHFKTPGYGWGTYLFGDSTWGTARTVSDVVLDPGIWSLDNFGQILIATIADGRTFTWDAGAVGARGIRASLMSGAPTASRLTLVSDRDRHLFHFGTETTIGTPSTQDPMFIRFSNQEDYNTYTPTATNTAGTFRTGCRQQDCRSCIW
jgi:hypothetical protein